MGTGSFLEIHEAELEEGTRRLTIHCRAFHGEVTGSFPVQNKNDQAFLMNSVLDFCSQRSVIVHKAAIQLPTAPD